MTITESIDCCLEDPQKTFKCPNVKKNTSYEKIVHVLNFNSSIVHNLHYQRVQTHFEDNEEKIANIKIVHKNLPSVSYQFIIIIYIKLVFTVISSTIKVYSFIFWQNILR